MDFTKILFISVFAVIVISGLVFWLSGGDTADTTHTDNMDTPDGTEHSPQQFTVTDTEVGTGATAVAGDTVSVRYEGRLASGEVFDSTERHNNQPFTFVLGAGAVITGWDQGVAGMKVGGKRTLVIPPELGYGVRGIGPIPPNATLTFDVELVDIEGK